MAFVDGVDLPGEGGKNLDEMVEIGREVTNEDLKVEWLYRTGDIIFRARGLNHRDVAQQLENALAEHFDREIHVTCRRASAVEELIQNIV